MTRKIRTANWNESNSYETFDNFFPNKQAIRDADLNNPYDATMYNTRSFSLTVTVEKCQSETIK